LFKKITSAVLATLMLAFVFVGCKSNTPTKTSGGGAVTAVSKEPNFTKMKGKSIGYIVAGDDIYYEKGYEVFDALATQAGATVTKVSSNYDPKLEQNNVQDLIAKKVSAIVDVTVNADNGAQCATLANNAKIPIFFSEALINKNGGKPAGSVTGDWYNAGVVDGKACATKYGANAKVVLIEGAYGQGTPELHTMGFEKGFGDVANETSAQVWNNNIIYAQTGQWATDQAVKVMQDAMSKTQGNFDAIFVQNEAMMQGVLQVLQNTTKKYGIYTINGQEGTIADIQEGTVEQTVSIPPTSEEEMVFQQMCDYFAGVKYPVYLKNFITPVNQSNVKTVNVLPWLDVNAYMSDIIAGKTGVDISKMKDSGNVDPDWSAQAKLDGTKS
jgi:ABC-type sugar transport system substrate-binding protein